MSILDALLVRYSWWAASLSGLPYVWFGVRSSLVQNLIWYTFCPKVLGPSIRAAQQRYDKALGYGGESTP